MANVGSGNIPFTPTPARGTGTTERLSTHRADDERLGEGFDRDVLKRESLYRVPVTRKGRKRSR